MSLAIRELLELGSLKARNEPSLYELEPELLHMQNEPSPSYKIQARTSSSFYNLKRAWLDKCQARLGSARLHP